MRRPRPVDVIVVIALAVMAGLAALSLPKIGVILASREIVRAARARDLTAWWRSISFEPPSRVHLGDLTLLDARGDTLVRAGRVDVGLDARSLLTLHPRVASLGIADAEVTVGRSHPVDLDTIPDTLPRRGRLRADHLPRIRETARSLVRLLVGAPERFPALALARVTVTVPDTEGARTLSLDTLALVPTPSGTRLEARGVAPLENLVPFRADLDEARDGRLAARVLFETADREGPDSLVLGLAGVVHRGTNPPSLTLAPGGRLLLGTIAFDVSGSASSREPRIALALAAKDIDEEAVRRSVPRSMLGPLDEVEVRGTFDYALRFDLDLAHPDSMALEAQVQPHDLVLDRARSRLALASLADPFTATIHLPHGQIAVRELSPANPHFLPLGAIDTTLAHAVMANEDGGFYRHHGFNPDAVRDALVEDLHAGAYRRGAGTITMQLARNLYLGHERTLARKAQEMVLAWMLEHLTGLGKNRLLEIYLNIIEWGPQVHGADEATWYYFGHGAGHVTPDEALFLATVVPAPSRWRFRFDRTGALRRYAREQMHAIGRAMIRKGWLAPEALPSMDSLRVALNGPARALVVPPDTGSAGREPGGPSRPGTTVGQLHGASAN